MTDEMYHSLIEVKTVNGEIKRVSMTTVNNASADYVISVIRIFEGDIIVKFNPSGKVISMVINHFVPKEE